MNIIISLILMMAGFWVGVHFEDGETNWEAKATKMARKAKQVSAY